MRVAEARHQRRAHAVDDRLRAAPDRAAHARGALGHLPDAIALLDRHYNALIPYRPNRTNLFAVRHGSHLKLRYVDFVAQRLVLRPHSIAFPVDLIEVDPDESPGDLIAGRVALILNET